MNDFDVAVLDALAIEWGEHGYTCWDDLENDFILNPSSREIDNKDLLQIAKRAVVLSRLRVLKEIEDFFSKRLKKLREQATIITPSGQKPSDKEKFKACVAAALEGDTVLMELALKKRLQGGKKE